MNNNKQLKKELLFYIGIVILLIIIIVYNNLFLKIGKLKNDNSIFKNNITYFESGNVIYNIPYEEQWLD